MEMIKKQKFGVEIEMTGITRENAAKVVADVLNGTIEMSEYRHPYYTRNVIDNSGRKWKVMRDSSIEPHRNDNSSNYSNLDEYRVEFVTPPLNYEDIETLQNCIRALKQNGGMQHSSCGIHVHVDGANHTVNSLRQLVNFFDARQNVVYKALGIDGTYRADRWCQKINKDIAKDYKGNKRMTMREAEELWYSRKNEGGYGEIDHTHYQATRYHGLNLHAFFSKGTVEFRLFNSTMHAGKIKAYVQFCLAVSAWAIENQDSRVLYKNVDNYTPKQNVELFEKILSGRLGLKGAEFKTCRLHMMDNLKKQAGMVSRAS